jgi:hypothetical protein
VNSSLSGILPRGNLNQGPRVIWEGPVADATTMRRTEGEWERRRAVINTGEAEKTNRKRIEEQEGSERAQLEMFD